MTLITVDESPLQRYLGALDTADVDTGITLVTSQLDSGRSSDDVLHEILRPAQVEVGRRWWTGQWSVADEHAATVVTEAALSALLQLHVPRPRASRTPRIVVACAPGEWHALPARMAAAQATFDGCRATVLGASTPAVTIGAYLQRTRADALVLSCTMPTNLIGAARTIAAAHAVGVPVLVGGAGWGPDNRRAARLGADGWSASAGEIAELAAARYPTLARAPELPLDALTADGISDSTLALVLHALDSQHPALAGMPEAVRDATLDDLRWVARFSAAAVACHDRHIVDDLLAWLLPLLERHDVDREVVISALRLLADRLAFEAPLTGELLADALTAVVEP